MVSNLLAFSSGETPLKSSRTVQSVDSFTILCSSGLNAINYWSNKQLARLAKCPCEMGTQNTLVFKPHPSCCAVIALDGQRSLWVFCLRKSHTPSRYSAVFWAFQFMVPKWEYFCNVFRCPKERNRHLTPETTLPQKLAQRINPILLLALISALLAEPKPTSLPMSKAVPALKAARLSTK